MGWEPFSGRLLMVHKNLPIGVDVGFHLRALKFKWSQLQDVPSCSKGGIRGWWEGVKGFRRARARGRGGAGGGNIGRPSYSLGRPPLKQQTRSGVPRALLSGPRIPHRVQATRGNQKQARARPPWLQSPRDATGVLGEGAGGAGAAGASLKVLSAHLAQLGALAFLPLGFVLTAVSIPPVTPRVIPDR